MVKAKDIRGDEREYYAVSIEVAHDPRLPGSAAAYYVIGRRLAAFGLVKSDMLYTSMDLHMAFAYADPLLLALQAQKGGAGNG